MRRLQNNPFDASPRKQRRLSQFVLVELLLSVLVLLVGSAVFLFPLQRSQGVTLSSNIPDTTHNIHIGLPFDHHTTPSAMSSSNPPVDYVFGSQYPGRPARTFHTFYLPYDVEENPSFYSQAHTLTWFKTNHPDWIEYTCGASTLSQSSANAFVAYEFGDTKSVPLDFSNPAVRQYQQQHYIIPALTGTDPDFSGKKFDGIAFDDPAFQNSGPWTGQRCGHYTLRGKWVQQYNATSDDPNFRSDLITWTENMQSWMHINYPNNPMSMNFSFDPSFPTDSNTLLSYIDIDFDEQGFTDGNSGFNPSDFTDTNWLFKMLALQAFLSGKHALISNNQEPVSFSQVTKAQVQWSLANYLLIKNNDSYFYLSGPQQYGYLFIRPEYSAPIGSAIDSMYQSQGIYMRDFTNGKAIVNPSSSTSYTVTLPSNTYKDLYGNTINSLVLPSMTGLRNTQASAIVLLCITTNCGASPTATATSIPNSTQTLASTATSTFLEP